MSIYSSLNFHLVKLLSNFCRNINNKAIYLTFDDGPEPYITEYIVNLLNEYNIKATFFCCGKNAESYPHLLHLLKSNGHLVANHTYSHINGLKVPQQQYNADVILGAKCLESNLFRPPWGALSLINYFYLRKKYKIILWDVVSNDTLKTRVDANREVSRMFDQIKGGDIILFHFVQKHSENTKLILPMFLEESIKRGFMFNVFNEK